MPSYHRHIMEAIHGPWPCEAKIDEARLVGMKCEPIPRKPLVQNTQNPLASRKYANAITASSANRTRVLLPSRRGRTSFSNHSSGRYTRAHDDAPANERAAEVVIKNANAMRPL